MIKKIIESEKANHIWIAQSSHFEGISDEGRFNEGLKLLEKLDLPAALKYYDEKLKSNPNEVELWNNLGVAFMGLKDRRGALKCYEKALELDPNYYIALYNKGAVYFECEKYKDAIEFFDKALEQNPTCGEAYWDKIIAKEQIGEASLEDPLELIKKGIDILRARFNFSSALVDLGNNKDAILGHFRLFLKDIHLLRKCLEKMEASLVDSGSDESINLIDNCLKINPEDPNLLMKKSVILFELERFEESLDVVEKALKVNPNIINGWILKGHLMVALEKFTEAIESFDNALSINPFSEFAKEGMNMLMKDPREGS